MPDLRSTAGRHAADLARRRTADAATLDARRLQDAAREALARAFRLRGLTVYPHFSPELEDERSLWVECRLASCREDHALVYAVLDDDGWQPDRERYSRVSARYEVLRLTHRGSGAKLALIVKIPTGIVAHWDAAA